MGHRSATDPHTFEENARLRALARGRVQGVFYRDFTLAHARRLRLTGWVRNLPDGCTVEVIAEGPRTALKELAAQLSQGPPASFVEAVEEKWAEPTGEFGYFGVR